MSEQVNDLVGRVKESPQDWILCEVGFTQEHLDKMAARINDRGWVDVLFAVGKTGNPYGKIKEPYVSGTKPQMSAQDDSADALPF